MIEGVTIKDLKHIPDERGWLMEVLRSDWDLFEKFGQLILSTAYTNVVKAWHMHTGQTDYLTCINGTIKLVLYDERKNSNTQGEINELYLAETNPLLVKIPPRIWHGFKAIDKMATVLEVTTEVYNYKKPDDKRLPPDTDRIPYDWKLAPWLKHG